MIKINCEVCKKEIINPKTTQKTCSHKCSIDYKKACHKAYDKAYRKTDKYKAYKKAYQKTDKFKAYQKAYYLRKKEELK